MPRPVFSWFPDIGSQCVVKPNVYSVKFGDGYEQRVSSTINANPEKWSVKFTCTAAVCAEIDSFLKARRGSEAFTWVNPENVSGTYVCREWSKNRPNPGVYEISCSFEQVFEY